MKSWGVQQCSWSSCSDWGFPYTPAVLLQEVCSFEMENSNGGNYDLRTKGNICVLNLPCARNCFSLSKGHCSTFSSMVDFLLVANPWKNKLCSWELLLWVREGTCTWIWQESSKLALAVEVFWHETKLLVLLPNSRNTRISPSNCANSFILKALVIHVTCLTFCTGETYPRGSCKLV